MSAASNYTETNVINALLLGVTFPLPTKTYVSLHTADPGEVGGSEVAPEIFPAYVRREAEAGGAIGSGWSSPVDGVSQNANQITYPGFDGAASVTVTHWAVFDAVSGGNCLCSAPLATARTLQSSDVFVFDVNSLTVTMD